MAALGVAVTAIFAGSCDSGGPVSEGEILSGTVEGQVTVDGIGQSGVALTLRTGTTTIATAETGSDGEYTFANVVAEGRTVAITPPSGTTCDPMQHEVTVTVGGTVSASFACVTPPAQTGTVAGTVLVDGGRTAGVRVFLGNHKNIRAMTTTGPEGTYRFSNVIVGIWAVSIESIVASGANCVSTQLNVFVPPDGTGTANFDCVGPRATVTGKVTLEGAALPGVPLSLRDATMLIATATTDQGGIYEFSVGTFGTRTLSIAQPSGTACTWSQLNIQLSARSTHTVNFDCRRLPPPPPPPPARPEMPSPEPTPPQRFPPQPPTGTVYGRVTLNGRGVPDVVVTLNKWSYGITVLATTRTRSDGSYAFEDVPRGEYLVRIEPPPGWEGCSSAGEVALLTGYWGPEANFVCPRPG